jgi:hypothetical protein
MNINKKNVTLIKYKQRGSSFLEPLYFMVEELNQLF